MRAVVQRVLSASVTVEQELIAEIGAGLLVLAAVGKGDTDSDVALIANKIGALRIFEDADGKMNLNIQQTGGSILLVSQFTLFGDVRKGNRPSFDTAELPEAAQVLFDSLTGKLLKSGLSVSTGKFRAHMKVQLINNGPITILLDSHKVF